MNLGYCCINMTLSDQGVSTNRSMIKKTFKERGISYASELALQNVRDLFTILKWNVQNGIKLFRVSSDIFPWASEYQLIDLPDYGKIKNILNGCGTYATTHNIRLTTHPGPYNVLCSPNPKVVHSTIRDLEIHGELFDLMGLQRSPFNPINIHCNGVYGDKKSALDRFCVNFMKLSDSVKSRLVVENDDKSTMYSVRDLMYLNDKIGIPITFDYHHYKFNTGDQTEQEAFETAIKTWGNTTPLVHYSESKSEHELNESIRPQAHSDYINELPNTYGYDVDIELECKAKELALLKIKRNAQ